jgi:hypothetical protein
MNHKKKKFFGLGEFPVFSFTRRVRQKKVFEKDIGEKAKVSTTSLERSSLLDTLVIMS